MIQNNRLIALEISFTFFFESPITVEFMLVKGIFEKKIQGGFYTLDAADRMMTDCENLPIQIITCHFDQESLEFMIRQCHHSGLQECTFGNINPIEKCRTIEYPLNDEFDTEELMHDITNYRCLWQGEVTRESTFTRNTHTSEPLKKTCVGQVYLRITHLTHEISERLFPRAHLEITDERDLRG